MQARRRRWRSEDGNRDDFARKAPGDIQVQACSSRVGQRTVEIWIGFIGAARLPADRAFAVMHFLENNCSEGWAGGKLKSARVGDEDLGRVPYLDLRLGVSQAYEEYKLLADANDGQRLVGYKPFAKMYNTVCKSIKQKHSLSYYFTDVLLAASLLRQMAERVAELYNAHRGTDGPENVNQWVEFRGAAFTLEELTRGVKTVEHFLKSGFARLFASRREQVRR
jgi:hypothetical protein